MEGVTRARVSQILALVKLAPEVQEMVLDADPAAVGAMGATEHRLRRLCPLRPEEQVAVDVVLLRRPECGTQPTGLRLASAEDRSQLLADRPSP